MAASDVYKRQLQRLHEKIAMYSFQVCWVPGKTHLTADALSRAPLFAPKEIPGLDFDTAISCLSQTSHPSIRLIYDSVDNDYRLLFDDVKNGSTLSSYSQALKGSLDILSVSDDLVLLNSSRYCATPTGCQA